MRRRIKKFIAVMVISTFLLQEAAWAGPTNLRQLALQETPKGSSRRGFLKQLAAMGAGALGLPLLAGAASAKQINVIPGITIMDNTNKDPKDPNGQTLAERCGLVGLISDEVKVVAGAPRTSSTEAANRTNWLSMITLTQTAGNGIMVEFKKNTAFVSTNSDLPEDGPILDPPADRSNQQAWDNWLRKAGEQVRRQAVFSMTNTPVVYAPQQDGIVLTIDDMRVRRVLNIIRGPGVDWQERYSLSETELEAAMREVGNRWLNIAGALATLLVGGYVLVRLREGSQQSEKAPTGRGRQRGTPTLQRPRQPTRGGEVLNPWAALLQKRSVAAIAGAI